MNNATQTALLANARFDFLGEVVRPALPPGDKLVIASLEVSFVREMLYGDAVFTGTRILSIGSMTDKKKKTAADKAAAPWPAAVRALSQAHSSHQ